MLKTILAVLAPFFFSIAHAVEQTEPPVEANTTGIVIFVVLTIVCFAAYGWYTWKAEKKSEEDKLGEKF